MKMARDNWMRWLLLLVAYVTICNGQQNHVDLHDDDHNHNPMGCDCMEYWACITRFFILNFDLKKNSLKNFLTFLFFFFHFIPAADRRTVIAVTWTRAFVATCREAPAL
jgi:hypothetical protein